ncbi:hypothetical protein D5086_033363 [Populus alba]|uniref:Uncharacterized protein n=1 Tax=Populus alba TaxID=43335 RepID=A0ACC4AGN4_POPAL
MAKQRGRKPKMSSQGKDGTCKEERQVDRFTKDCCSKWIAKWLEPWDHKPFFLMEMGVQLLYLGASKQEGTLYPTGRVTPAWNLVEPSKGNAVHCDQGCNICTIMQFRTEKADSSQKELAVRAAAASIYSTCGFPEVRRRM